MQVASATGRGRAHTSAGPSSLELAGAASSPSSVSESRVSPLSDSSAAGAGACGGAGAGAPLSDAVGVAAGAPPSAVTARSAAAAVAKAGASAACGNPQSDPPVRRDAVGKQGGTSARDGAPVTWGYMGACLCMDCSQQAFGDRDATGTLDIKHQGGHSYEI